MYMVRYWAKWGVLLLCVWAINPAFAHQTDDLKPNLDKTHLVFGVLSFRPEAVTRAQWQPLMRYLEQNVDCGHCTIELKPLGYEGLEQALQAGKVDLVMTNPSHYILLRERMNLKMSGPLVTLTRQQDGHAINEFAGVIFTRADHEGVYQLSDLLGYRIAAVTTGSLGGYQMQAYELFKAGMALPNEHQLELTGMPHDKVVHQVLSGQADVGFVRSGILEAMSEQGELRWQDVRLINPQISVYPFVHSTPLYPEWPVVALSSVSERQANSLTVALLQLTPEHPAAQAAEIIGFTRPKSYEGVESVMRSLRVAPFDAPIETDWHDVWQQYRWAIIGLMLLLVLLSLSLVSMLGLNRHLTQQRKLANEASQAKSAFLANMSHELRTPMNGVLGLTELALKETSLPKMRQKILKTHQSARLLLGIINDILDFSKIEANRLEVEARPFYLSTLMDQLYSLFMAIAQNKGLRLEMRIDSNLAKAYIGDEVRIRQVLTNLIGNAIKFTQQGHVVLSVSASADQSVMFEVSDSGIGIQATQLTDLFHAFSQADMSITRQYGGTGLGLAISQRLVRAMGGAGIEVESALNEGSCFRFRLSLVQCSLEQEQALFAEMSQFEPISPMRPILFGRVLLVEDNEINQEVARELLSQLGLEISLANNGAQAVEKVKIQTFDLILMDIQMPIMDGYQACKAIRQFNSHIPIVALTAAATVEDRDKALAAGMNDHLTKPIMRDQLIKTLKPFLEENALRVAERDGAIQAEEVSSLAMNQALAGRHVSLKRRILIVDDQVTNIKVLANGLSSEYVILAANSGEKALQIATSDTKPDLVLLDIVMPQMDGYEVLRRLKENPLTQTIPVMFVTALDASTDEQKGLELGAVDYITKPFKLPIVKARVKTQIDLKVKTDLLDQQSHIDGLTHIANRRMFDETVKREQLRLMRSGQPLGLIMVDIDYFKPFNDHYGHGKGDECLFKVAQALQSVFHRPADLLARYGGEEFIAILPETDIEGVMAMAEKMRQAVWDMDYPHAFSSVAERVTVSLGVVSGLIVDDNTIDVLMQQADQALYRAKASGRNQMVRLNETD